MPTATYAFLLHPNQAVQVEPCLEDRPIHSPRPKLPRTVQVYRLVRAVSLDDFAVVLRHWREDDRWAIKT